MIRKNMTLKDKSIAIVCPINDMKSSGVKWLIEPFNKSDSRYYDTTENVCGYYLSLKYVSQFRKRNISSYIRNFKDTLKNRTRYKKDYPISYYNYSPRKIPFKDIRR